MRSSATAVTILLMACGVSQADDSTDMQGVWLPVEAALGMQQLPRDTLRSMRLKIAGGQYEVVVGNEADRGRLKLDATLTPKALDIVGTEGPNKGKTILGVYELTGDTLAFATTSPATPGPGTLILGVKQACSW